jgi:hypothetical protein
MSCGLGNLVLRRQMVSAHALSFFPESERNGPPDGGRPHSIFPDTPGACACEVVVGGGEMTMVTSELRRT